VPRSMTVQLRSSVVGTSPSSTPPPSRAWRHDPPPRTGDLHLGAGLGYSDDRIADQARVLAQIAASRVTRHVDGVLIAGDVFHRATRRSAPSTSSTRLRRRLAFDEIRVVAITGNKVHDIVNADEPCALELFADETSAGSAPPRRPASSVAGVDVACLPNVPVDRLVATIGGRDEDVNALAVRLLDVAAELRAEVPAGARAVLLGHWSVTGAALPNGLPTDSLNEPVLPLDALEAAGLGRDRARPHPHRPAS
jgi:DNA repair exonuclease SbcCD nuclease subunit